MVKDHSAMSSFIVIGGCGFIGRAIVETLKKTGAASHVYVVDKKMAGMSNMTEK